MDLDLFTNLIFLTLDFKLVRECVDILAMRGFDFNENKITMYDPVLYD
jgi:hypothetical protein